MGFPSEAGETTRGIDGADVRPYAFERGEGAALGFDFAEDVFADAGAEVGRGAGEPATFFLDEVRSHALGFLGQVKFVASGFVEGADCFVDFFSTD